MRTSIYIDGFNLYYGAVKDTPYKWLNLDTLCRLLLAMPACRTGFACVLRRLFPGRIAGKHILHQLRRHMKRGRLQLRDGGSKIEQATL